MNVPPSVRDSRRLTGANLVSPGPAAVMDIATGSVDKTDLVEALQRQLGRILPAVGWAHSRIWTRVYPDGVTVAFDAPIDALYAATEVNEWAFDAATAGWRDAPRPRLDQAVERLSDAIADERNPRLLEIQAAARERQMGFTWDDDHASVGMGSGSISWATDRLPPVAKIPWESVHDVPVVLVTGSNGKTTTVRMLAAIARAWGRRSGYCCTDGIYIGDDAVDTGDWSGPGGARAVLRDTRVDFAILETARGGLLRRGLAIERADAALVSNIAADHLGEWGVYALSEIAAAKLVVRHAVTSGALVVNADDDVLATAVKELDADVAWLSALPPTADSTSAVDPPAWSVVDDALARGNGEGAVPFLPIADLPSAMGGSARYNVYNALGAAALADAVGVPLEVVAEGLRSFGANVGDNPGRGERFAIGGADFIVDFAHNPHGVRALGEWVRGQEREGRLLTMVGQAGDRTDASIRDLARATVEMEPDFLIIKGMPDYARGREPDEIVAILREAALDAGLPEGHLGEAASEFAAAEQLLDMARPGDLVVLPVQAERQAVLELLLARS